MSKSLALAPVNPQALRQLDSRGRPVVRGWWMDSDAAGCPRQRTVTRSLGNRSAQEAWAQVEQIVRQGIEREAHKARAAASRQRFAARASGQVESHLSRSSSA